VKIKRLDLKAYGHFTDCSIDFGSDTPGLHIIYGQNEAGKSTSLRALRGLLYGIPTRTPDNFLHDYSSLLIGGQVQNSDGRELTFWRRKKSKGDLQDVDYNIIDQTVLAEFLHGIEEPLFEALFGIDHETLVSGGRDILEQKGDIGQALFSAGAGLSSLHGVIEQMEQECENLFKSGGSRPEINQAVKAYQEIKKEIRNLSLSSADWKAQKEIYDSASRELEQVEEQKRALGAELERLKRLQRALPHLVNRLGLKDSLVRLNDFSHLPHDFSERLDEALASRKQVDKSVQEACSRKGALEEKKLGISLRHDILDQSESIDDLHQTLGVQRQAAQDRPDIHSELIECRTKAETLLNQLLPTLELSRVDKIKELLARRTTIQPLGNRFAGLEKALSQTEAGVESIQKELGVISSRLEGGEDVGPLQGLSAAMTTAHKAGDIDQSIRTLQRDIASIQSEAVAALKRIGLWNGSPQELLSLPLPSTATIDSFVEKYRELSEALRQNQQDRKGAQQDRERVAQEVEAMEKAGSVVIEQDLLRIRERRDQGWQLIKRAWLESESLEQEIRLYDESEDLPGAFEKGMHEADDVSDQLRASAERVHQYASLLAEADKLDNLNNRLTAEGDQLAVQKDQFEQTWQASWQKCQIAPLTPREMRSWIDQCHEIIRSVGEGTREEAERQSLMEQRQQRVQALADALQTVGQGKNFVAEDLSAALAYSGQIHDELKAIQDQRRSLKENQTRKQKELIEAEQQLNMARQEMDAWQKQWSAALEGFGLPAAATADDAANALDTLRTVLDKVAEMSVLKKRLEDIDQHAERFEISVKALVRSVASELEGLPSDQVVVKLQAMVKEAEKDKSILEKIDEDLDAVAEQIRQARVDQHAVAEELTALRELARCDDDEGLIKADCCFRKQQQLKAELDSVEATLLGIAEGVDLEELEEQRQTIDPNELPGQVETLSRQIQNELEPQIKALSEKKGRADSELGRMDGSSDAAAMEDKAQAALAKVRRLADRYIRVRLGNKLLKKEIERYRQENQDPILKLASRYFCELTLASFPGLRSDVDDRGTPILVGVCPDGRTKTVEEMSSGARDQLYLALRLATLEWRMEKHEPMPFIADDILVNFDDERSTATLKALAGLARKNQVILFTHHKQIVETVESLGMEGHVVVHPLKSLTATTQ